MNLRVRRFNLYLLAALALIAVGGCQSDSAEKKPNKKLLSTLRLHAEGSRGGTAATETVPIYRLNPVMVRVEKLHFIDEGHVSSAKVIDVMGGYALEIQFDHRGTSLLEEYTTVNRPRRIAIFSQFGGKLKQVRWLGAPMASRRISDGVLTFTPDATREEAEEIAAGLNNVAKKVKTWIER
jgi:preprotein translocase subunit SecD